MDKKILLEILDKSAMSLAGLEFVPYHDKDGEIIGAQLVITTDLVDPFENELNTVGVIEKHLLGEGQTLEEVISKQEQKHQEEEEE